MATTRQKGNVLEDLVALLHGTVSASVETRVKLPVLDDPDAVPREIDVLVSYDVAGYPDRIAFECKNEQERLGIEYVDAFVGKLEDIGIPASQGVLVSAVGFTKDAKRRAAKARIHMLCLEGLDKARLSTAINAALLQLVHFVLFIESMSMFPYLPGDASGERWPEGLAFNESEIQNLLWRRWVTDKAPAVPGENIHIFLSGRGGAAVQCRVVAYVGRVPGTASFLRLRNAASGTVEQSRFEAQFNMPNTVALEVFNSADRLAELEEALRREGHLLAQRIRVPRIVDVTGRMFWPPSRDAVAKINALRASGQCPTFANVEGKDLSRAWEVFELRRAARTEDDG